MKKLTLCVMTAFMFLLFHPTQLKANTDTEVVSTTESTTIKAAEANAMAVRLNEIKEMDLSILSSSEKRELRKEVRGIKSELRVNGESTYIQGSHDGVYISVGAAILIVLLLVLLL